jgi:hypothetical protein
MPGRPPTRRAHRAEQGATRQTVLHGRRTNLPTVVPSRGLPKHRRRPNRRLPKHRRRNRRNKRHRFTASSSCLLPVGPVARRDGGGGDRARALHASNFAEIGGCRLRHPGRCRNRSPRNQWPTGTSALAKLPFARKIEFRFDLIDLSAGDLPTRLLESSPVARAVIPCQN